MQGDNNLNNEVVLNKLNRLLFTYYYSLSINAASKTDYTLAAYYISELHKSNGETPVVLDLQAKIAAQQGNFKEAEFLWKKCLAADPDNTGYIAALNRINKLLTSKAFRFYGFIKLLIITAAILLFAILILLFIRRQNQINDKLSLLSGKQNLTGVRIDSVPVPKIVATELLATINDKVNTIKGINTTKTSNELLIVFNSGLFSRGTKIDSLKITPLLQLAKMLESFAGKVVIKIIGSTDDVPIKQGKFQSNMRLSIERASMIHDLIYKNSRIPNEDLLIGSINETNYMFSNDNAENRSKNRTVIIKVVQK